MRHAVLRSALNQIASCHALATMHCTSLDFARFDAELWSAFLSGYSCVRELIDHELEAIPVFTVARSIWKIGQLIANADRWGHRALTPQYLSRALRSITDAAKETGYAEPGSKTLGDSST